MKLHHFMYNCNNIFHIAIYNSFNGVLQMLQRSYSVVKIYLFQFINVYAHWVVVGYLGYFRQKYLLLNYILLISRIQLILSMYSETCLIMHTKGPGKRVGLYRMLKYSGFILVHKNTLGP